MVTFNTLYVEVVVGIRVVEQLQHLDLVPYRVYELGGLENELQGDVFLGHLIPRVEDTAECAFPDNFFDDVPLGVGIIANKVASGREGDLLIIVIFSALVNLNTVDTIRKVSVVIDAARTITVASRVVVTVRISAVYAGVSVDSAAGGVNVTVDNVVITVGYAVAVAVVNAIAIAVTVIVITVNNSRWHYFWRCRQVRRVLKFLRPFGIRPKRSLNVGLVRDL